MIEEIVLLKQKGYSLRNIAYELNTTVGKVQYRLKKYTESIHGDDQSVEKLEDPHWELPPRYDQTRITIMPQNPFCVYAYWEIDQHMQHLISHHLTTEWPKLSKQLRIHDVSDILFDGHHSHRYIDIPLPEMTDNWFIRNLIPNRTYVSDFGIRTGGDHFLTIVRSNPVETPRAGQESLSRHRQPVLDWKHQKTEQPSWYEHFSTYSYYR